MRTYILALLLMPCVGFAQHWFDNPRLNPDEKMALCITFDEGPNARDCSQFAQTTTVNGVTFSNQVGCFYSDTVKVDYAASLATPTNMTYMAWVYATTLAGDRRGVFAADYTTWCPVYFGYDNDGNLFSSATWGIASFNNVAWQPNMAASNITADTGTWRHIAFTYDHNTKRFYVDGKMVAEASDNTWWREQSIPRYLGSWDISKDYWQGMIDDMRVYRRVLTPDAIAAYVARTRRHLP